MARLRETQFVGADNLRWDAQPFLLLLIGDIGCLGNILITVEKYLALVTEDSTPAEVLDGDHDILVQTIEYSYHAQVCGHGMILRYDNNHPWPKHGDDHHVHRGDWRAADDDKGRVFWVGEDRWPTLGDVIREVAEWHGQHYDELEFPDQYATPLHREPRTRWNPAAGT